MIDPTEDLRSQNRHQFRKTEREFCAVLGRINYPGFTFRLGYRRANPYLQIHCDGTDNVTGEAMKWSSRKWWLSEHMTDGEIVQTAFKAVLTAIEHEARELFMYRDVSVFDPHYDIEKLVELRNRPDALKARPQPPGDAS